MRNYPRETFTNAEGLIITATQGRVLRRRQMVEKLFAEMSSKYASRTQLYKDIAEIVQEEMGCEVTETTVRRDLMLMKALTPKKAGRRPKRRRKTA